jgi:DNA polymerase V
MSIVGLRLHKELNGVKCLDIDLPASKKMIATTRSFDKNYSDKKVIKERVTTY